MLTQKDLDEIKQLIDEEFTKRLKFLPSKEEFYNTMDQVMGELKAIREELAVVNDHVSHHTDQLENHETRISKIEQTTSPA